MKTIILTIIATILMHSEGILEGIMAAIHGPRLDTILAGILETILKSAGVAKT